MRKLVRANEPRQSAPAPVFALWQLGFRPFYLLASAFAAVSISLWALQVTGALAKPYLPGALWHAHEMLFGFVMAVVVGFLFTAGRSWTNQPTPTGWPLMLLAALWLAGRILVVTPWSWASAFVNPAFPVAAAVALGRALGAARNRRNYFFVALLGGIAAAQFLVHVAVLGNLALSPWTGVQVGLDLMLVIITVMAGRVVPMFTNNGVPGAAAERRRLVEVLSLGSVLVLAVADLVQLSGATLTGILIVGAIAHFARWMFWKPWQTLRVPLVWVLHGAYVWIPAHLVMRSLSGSVPASLATHALTVGAIGGLIIGMMTRTARGHTGLPLRASKWDMASYGLVFAGAIVRVFGPLMPGAPMGDGILLSAALWAAAFLLYAVQYVLPLTTPRRDGRPA